MTKWNKKSENEENNDNKAITTIPSVIYNNKYILTSKVNNIVTLVTFRNKHVTCKVVTKIELFYLTIITIVTIIIYI